MGVGVEDTVLAPESEFQLQAAYSPSPSPPPSQQSGRSLRQTKGASELPPRAVPASAGLLPPPPGLQFFGKFGGGGGESCAVTVGLALVGPQEGICFLGSRLSYFPLLGAFSSLLQKPDTHFQTTSGLDSLRGCGAVSSLWFGVQGAGRTSLVLMEMFWLCSAHCGRDC